MLLFVFISVILELICMVTANNDNNSKVTLILDYITLQNKPTKLVVWRNCFESCDMLELMRNSTVFMTIRQKDSLSANTFESDPHHWLFVTDMTCSMDAASVIEKVFWNCNNMIIEIYWCEFFQLQIEPRLFSHPYRWLIFQKNDEFHNKVSSFPDSDILIANSTDDGGFILRQFYRTEPKSGEIIYEHFGLWTPHSGLIDEREVKINSRRRKNLLGKLMTVSYVHLDKASRNHLSDFVDTQTDALLKTNYIILNAVLDNLNVTKKELFQSTWGYYNPKTKKWSGMMRDIVEKGADIGGCTKKSSTTCSLLTRISNLNRDSSIPRCWPISLHWIFSTVYAHVWWIRFQSTSIKYR